MSRTSAALAEREVEVEAGYAVETTGLRLLHELDQAGWEALGATLAQRAGALQWAMGDWLLLHRGEWGEMYDAAARITGYTIEHLYALHAVASAFPAADRDPALSWSAHRIAKSAPTGRVMEALGLAKVTTLSRLQVVVAEWNAALRTPVEQAKQRRKRPMAWSHVTCPKCGHSFPIKGNRAQG